MAGEEVCDIEVSLQSVPSLDGLAHFDDAIYKPHSVMVKIKPTVIVWLSALHNFFVCLFCFCTLRFIPIVTYLKKWDDPPVMSALLHLNVGHKMSSHGTFN